MTISAELSGALRYCGHIGDETITLPTLYKFYLDACLLMDADLEFSESFRQLKVSDTFSIDNKEQSLTMIAPYDLEIGLDYRLAGSTDRWRRVQIVAPERVTRQDLIRDWFATGWWIGDNASRVGSFYGQNPRHVILSFEPAPYEFRLWSVPAAPADRSNQNEESGLPAMYAPLRELLTANAALPHCEHDEVMYERLQSVIDKMLAIWQPRWERFKNRPLKREGSRRPGFRRSMRNRRSMVRY